MFYIKKAWDIISQRDDRPSQVALAIFLIAILFMVGLIISFVYGFSVRPSGSGFWSSCSGGAIAVGASFGSFSMGGLLGLLFGSPSLGGRAGPVGQKNDSKIEQMGVRPNTSLERMADWLTTMIVGLGLVNLVPIKLEATAMAVWLTQSISGEVSGNGTPGISIVLGFGFSGFLMLYLWAMRFLPSELRESYGDLVARVDNAEKNKKIVSDKLEIFKKMPYFEVDKNALSNLHEELKIAKVDEATCQNILARYQLSVSASSEPMQYFGPKGIDDFLISAAASSIYDKKYEIKIQLKYPKGESGAIGFWLLHNSFRPNIFQKFELNDDGLSNYYSVIDEAFCIGVIVVKNNGEVVKLSYSMYDIENPPPGFFGD